MKILVLDEEFPWPLNTGKRIRSFNLISRLAIDHQVTYLAFENDDTQAGRKMATAGIEPVSLPPRAARQSGIGFYGRLAANLFSPYPYSVASHWRSDFQAEVDRRLASGEYDVVLCEWTPYGRYVLNDRAVPRVVSAHNVETQIWQRYLESESSAARRWYIARQVRKMEAFERAVFGQVEGITAVSSEDAATVNVMGGRKDTAVIDNGVDLEYYRPSPVVDNPSGPALVFTGSMDWRPNQDAARYFVDDILPQLRSALPDMGVTFVGRNPPKDVRELEKVPGVTVTGTVEDVRPYVREALIYIVPLRIGGGSRLKILEALAMGKAVVSTPVGAEGLRVTDGRDLLIAENADAWVERIVELVNDQQRLDKLGHNGRSLVEKHYGWPSMAARLEEFLQQVIDR